MSLTSLLKANDSAISRFFKEVLPETRHIVAGTNSELKRVETVRASGHLAPWYPTLGTAIDYRLRYYFPATRPDELIAHQGALRLAFIYDHLSLPVEVVEEFFDCLCDLLRRIQPAAQRLPPEQEREMCRYCFVLALFDQVVRAGPNPNSALFSMAEPSFEALLQLAPEACLEDLCHQSWLFHDQLGDQTGRPHALNPTFSGSNDVGGADADLILDGCLIDFKSTINPKITSTWLYQLLGYALLDYRDEHQITRVGIYFSRQGVLLQWDLADLIRELSTGPPIGVDQMRTQFSSLFSGGSRFLDL